MLKLICALCLTVQASQESEDRIDRIIDMAEREIQKFDLSFLELEKVPNYTAKLMDL